MSQQILVRAATIDDLTVLLDFEQRLIDAERPHASNLKSGHITYYDLPKLINSDLAKVAVVQVGSDIVASGYARIESSKPQNISERHSYLGFMYVTPQWRGQQLNKLILDDLIDWSREQGITTCILDVYASNEAAIKAYRKVGFKTNLLEMVLES